MSRQPPLSRQPRPTMAGPAIRGFAGFSDRVMARVAAEPTPTPARVFLHSALRLRPRDAMATLVTAWHLAFGRSGPIPALVRVQSLVMLLVFTVVVSTGGTLAAAGAVRIVESPREPRQVDRQLVLPSATPGPTISLRPVVPATPDPSPSGSPGAMERGPAKEKPTSGAGRAEQGRQSPSRSRPGTGDKVESKGADQKKQPARTIPRPAVRKQTGSDTPKSGAGSRNDGGSTRPEQKALPVSTPKPRDGAGAKSEEGSGGGSVRGS